ncbi:hypothetical protein EXU48_13000 [Occultella glacieicola]|uniref:Uncharacterized protein n=1 Tax=Occultella glacieicola TaxID=2518684 RepID=A0ABY2E1K7_9MICO|nr:hypothetical protein [Occultella glacieicola]TDE92472.1 hypothetical protein EXU48_13000 [Occultella glacieicola]
MARTWWAHAAHVPYGARVRNHAELGLTLAEVGTVETERSDDLIDTLDFLGATQVYWTRSGTEVRVQAEFGPGDHDWRERARLMLADPLPRRDQIGPRVGTLKPADVEEMAPWPPEPGSLPVQTALVLGDAVFARYSCPDAIVWALGPRVLLPLAVIELGPPDQIR